MSISTTPEGRIQNTAFLPAQHDGDGNVPVTMGTTLAGEDIQADVQRVTNSGQTSVLVTSSGAVLCMTGRGVIVNMCITNTSGGQITVYDSLTTSGTILAVLKASIVEGNYLQGLPFSTGLTLNLPSASTLTMILSR